MVRKRNYWTLERCKKEARKYSVLQHLVKANAGCFQAIKRHEWEEQCFSHIVIAHKHPLPDMEECKRIALRYKTRTEFQKSEHAWLYQRAMAKGFLDELCEHMDELHNLKERCIYAVTFPDNAAYIGLTCNTERRWSNHLRMQSSPVFKHAKATGLEPKFAILHDYMPAKEARELEPVYIKEYVANGYRLLNKSLECGQMGSVLGGHSKEECLKEARKYKTLKEFREKSPGYYESAYRSDYWEEVRNMLKVLHMPHKWTDKELHEAAQQCSTRSEFQKRFKKQYETAKRRGLDKFCQHMKSRYATWTDEDLRAAALQCSSRSEFMRKFHKQYQCAYHKGMDYLDSICQHMGKPKSWRKR